MWRDLQVSATWGDDLLEAARRARYGTNNSNPTKKKIDIFQHTKHTGQQRGLRCYGYGYGYEKVLLLLLFFLLLCVEKLN